MIDVLKDLIDSLKHFIHFHKKVLKDLMDFLEELILYNPLKIS